MEGIYKIIINNRFYIGSSKNIGERIKQHQRLLVNNTHYNKKLQNSYNKYKSFDFEVLELTNNLLTREQYWIDLQKPCLNIDLIVTRSERSKDTLLKLKKALKNNVNAGRRVVFKTGEKMIFFNSIKQCMIELNLTEGSIKSFA